MKQLILTLCMIIFMSINSFAQSLEKFKSDFKKALSPELSEQTLNEMFNIHATFLTPHSSITQLMSGLKNGKSKAYPLFEFKSEKLYQENIEFLFNSSNINHRILSYLVIASSRDFSFEERLLEKIKTETEKGAIIWSGMALLHMGTERSTPLFDFIVENENFGNAQMMPLLFNLRMDSLMNTAYRKIKDDNVKAKILAVQIFSKSELNAKTEKALKKAVKEWEIGIKGYAIYSLKELEVSNLLPVLKPLLDSTQTRSIALGALANSKTREDQEFFLSLFENKEAIPKNLLDCLFNSKNADYLKLWLKIVTEKKIPEKYYFLVSNQPLLFADEILPELQTTLNNIDNNQVKQSLIRALKGREDEKSIDIFVQFLRDKDSSVRYWTASALEKTNSQEVIQLIPQLLNSQELRTSSLTKIVIENNVDNLQEVFEDIYDKQISRDWKRSSIEYLSTFPKAEHKKIFRNILKDEEEDIFIKKNAALGLGRLNDVNSIELINQLIIKEAEVSDFNVRIFLTALGLMKTDKSKNIIERFKDSDAEPVRELVNEIITNW